MSLDSPDGSLNATIDDAMEIGMGAPTRGDLVISTGLTILDCGPSIVWSHDSRYLAVPQWQPYDNGHSQRIVVISIERNAFRPVGRKFVVLELASFVDGIVCGIDCPATVKTPVEIDTQLIDW
ncbi:MAG: hypothetical protein AAF802_20095 [Planctomycetota bacterium]